VATRARVNGKGGHMVAAGGNSGVSFICIQA
jgi:hypothetical protein